MSCLALHHGHGPFEQPAGRPLLPAVAHGRSAAPADAASRDHHLANHLSFIPGPLHAGAAQLQVSHLTYHTSYPHAAFNPYLFLTPLSPVPSTRTSTSSSTKEASQGGTTLAVALYSGSSVRYLHATVSRQAVQPAAATAARGRQLPPDQPRSAALTTEDSEMDSSSVFLSPGSSRSSTPSLQPPQAPPAAWQQQQQQQQPQHVQQPLPSQQQQQQQGAPTHSWPAFHHPPNASARSSPWRQPQQRQWQQQDQQQDQQQHVPLGADSMQQPCLDTHVCLVSCTHAGQHAGSKTSTWQAPSHGLASRRSGCVGGGGACQASAAVSLLEAPAQLDLEASIYAALQQRGVPPSALVDYAAAPMLACCWGEEEGLLLLAVLRLSRQPAPTGFGEEQRQEGSSQPQHRTACVLLHAAARSGVGAEVEWLEAPYPWHHDLSAFLVQQTAFSASGPINPDIKKDVDKVVDSVSLNDLDGKKQVSYCRCWRSATFPLCNGAHVAHNKASGDNVGPLLVKASE
ncbi:CDGSH iron-sulfur domain-containing protein NEET [Chlorella vulgaris]